MPGRAGRGTELETYAVLLRGVNLGARNKLPMADLRALFVALGAEDVATYVQSGNVVFKSSTASDELTRAIEQQISRNLGLSIAVLLRSQAELARVVADNPFAGGAREPAAFHVTFLAEAPDGARVAALDRGRASPDEFQVIEQEVYLHCPNGYGRSKLSNAYFEKELGVAATTRNWRTVTNLAALTSA